MASSNIKLFDENKGNMLSDSEFSISNQRMNGLQTGVASSQLQNKAMYQASLVAYAIAQVMMQNGKNANDTDAVSAFVANLSGTMLQKVYDIATTAEAQAGVATGKWMSPALVKAAIDSLAAKAQNILSDKTKALYGLSNTAVPDDLFVSLTNYFPQILVTTVPNTEVTASLNGKTVRATSDSSGLAILKIPGFGTWTVSATIDGAFISASCEIKAIAQYELSLVPDLETASWDIIDTISKNGNAASVWSVGDKKTVNIGGTNYQVQIIGFDHDTKTSGGKAGITFQLVDCLYSAYQMNSSDTNSGGWTRCAMRISTMATLLTNLPSALQNVIKAVNKLTSAGNMSSTINTTSDKLFLLSEVEIFGSTINSESGEGSQYAYYKAGNSKVKKVNGSASIWWERSPVRIKGNSFCRVSRDGKSEQYSSASLSEYVAFGFCV